MKIKKIIASVLALAMVLTLKPYKAVRAADSDKFVKAVGTKFYVEGHPFYFTGANAYDIFTYGDGSTTTDPARIENNYMNKTQIDSLMNQMAVDGVKVVRTWGFSNESWHGFEPSKGVYNEAEFMLFDYIMESARKNGIKVIITLENYWEAYGGIDKKLQWEGLSGGSAAARTEFFRNANCKTHYKAYAEHFINRINHYSGIAYKDDPTIFAWELMNEPRYQDAPVNENSTGTTLRKWVDEMASYIKTLDTNHMVGTGLEGHQIKYGFGGDEGNPFVYIHQSPYIDFCSAHPYPDESWANLSPSQTGNLMAAWIRDAHDVVGKPFVMGEFNTHNNKDQYWQAAFGKIDELGAAGGLFWNYNYRYLDDFTIMHGDSILTYYKSMSDKMAAKNGGTNIDTQAPTAPGNLTSPSKTYSSVSLSWTASTDNVGVTGYNVYNGSALIGTTAAASFTVTGLDANTTYVFSVKAKDAAGNISTASNSLSVTTPVDPNGNSTNIAYNKTSAASSTESSSLQPAYAFDGNTSTRWSSVYSDPQWISVDLGSAYNVNRVKLNWETAYGKAYKIQVSNDGAAWTDVYSTASGDGGVDDITFTPVSARYVRMYGNTRGTSWGYSLYEFEVYQNGGTNIDTQAPTAPASLTSPSKTSNSVSLSWTASSDNVGVTGYNIYNGSALAGSSTVTSYTVTGLNANTTYSFTVKARDAAGNISSASNTLTVTTNPDVTKVAAPTFSIPAGTYASAQTVAISCATSGAAIRYTTDGSNPTSSSPVYSGPVTVSKTTTIKAYAVKAGMTDSNISSASYTISPQANYIVTYTVSSDWGTGATINVTIKNNSSVAINGWTLVWNLATNQQMSNMWNAAYTASGNTITARNVEYNSTISANGGTQSFGFNINYSGTLTKPTSFTLNGTVCQVQ